MRRKLNDEEAKSGTGTLFGEEYSPLSHKTEISDKKIVPAITLFIS
jgi:hypothetical protein